MTTKRKREWFDDALWRDLYPFIFPDTLFGETPKEIEKVLSLTGPVGKRALDLCCGPGRCAIALALQDFAVTGVDKNDYLLNKARAKAKIAKVFKMDMRDFVRPGCFGLVLSMFTSFGHFDDKTHNIDILRNIFAFLRSEGVFSIDVMGKEQLAKTLQPMIAVARKPGNIK